MGNKAKHGRIRFIDLFAGCGGLSEGFIQAGHAPYPELVTALGDLMAQARTKVARTVNQTLVTTYWQMGRYIVEYEQNGADRSNWDVRELRRHELAIAMEEETRRLARAKRKGGMR